MTALATLYNHVVSEVTKVGLGLPRRRCHARCHPDGRCSAVDQPFCNQPNEVEPVTPVVRLHGDFRTLMEQGVASGLSIDL